MMADLGTIAVLLGLALSLYAAASSVAGRLAGIPELVVSGRRAAYMTIPAAAIGSGALVTAFVNHDFSIKYVYEHSNLVMDREFIWVAFYAGNDGSLLYIATVYAGMAGLAIWVGERQRPEIMPFTSAILMGVLAFFFFVLAVFANPFAPLEFFAADGLGINPLLSHPAMFVHPPLLMAGLAGIALPFAYAAGALISGRTADEWLDLARVSGIVVWAILGSGVLLGAWWAYTILGWGGYWGWDPIENVALMPWLAMTAFIHSVMVQKRRGMFRMWNIVLLNVAFVLAQFGMFINRGGPVVSVHSFAASTLGAVFLSFMILSALFAFGVFFWRYPMLRSDRPIESFLSREVAFLVNNFLLLGIVFVTLWGVVFPLITEFASDGSVTVATPYFNRVNGPLFLVLIALMGIGPVLAWRKASGASVRRWLTIPLLLSAATALGLASAGIREPIAILAFAVLVFVASVIAEEWIRGTLARRRAGDNWALGWWRLLNGNRPRHGGYVVHLAILLLAFGVVGTQFFDQRGDFALRPGEAATIGDYRLVYTGSEETPRSDRVLRTGSIDVYKGATLIETLRPWHAFYPAFNQASVRAAIRSTPIEDLYVVPSDFLSDGRLVLRVSINPLAWWLWIAGPVFIAGTALALWPNPATETRRAPSPARPPAAAGPSSRRPVPGGQAEPGSTA
ncbi:MAG: heme lyase CcmF/NrfE family subunit [SAR202 cluster bacterium]|nr:heme lyase CcmF/NrfE family subunit [SAR202 cluster bacterium]